MSYKCPSCGSSQTASIGVARARETQSGKFGGLGIDTGGEIGVFGGVTSSTSAFGKTLAPRAMTAEKRTTIVPAIVIVLGGFLAFVFWIRAGGVPRGDRGQLYFAAIVALVAAVAGVVWFAVNAMFNAKAEEIEVGYQARENAKWSKKWVCYQCGEKFDPAQ